MYMCTYHVVYLVNSIGCCPNSLNVHIAIHIFNLKLIIMNFHEIKYKM